MPKITTNLFGNLAFFPFQPEAPVKERLDWLTNVIESYDGSEDRIQTRSMPRQSFEYSIPLQHFKKSDAFNTLYGGIRQNWIVPLWTEAQSVGEIAEGQTVIPCDTTNYDLRDNSIAMLFTNDKSYQIVEIATITVSGATLFAGATQRSNTWLIPLRRGFIEKSVDFDTTGWEGSLKIKFHVDDNMSLTPATPTQYDGKDIYYEPTLFVNSLKRTIEKRQDLVDYDLGPVARRSPWLNARMAIENFHVCDNSQEVQEFKEFLYRRAGKYREFWRPTFENDIHILSTGVVGVSLNVKFDSYTDYAQNRTHIAVKDKLGNWYPREIVDSYKIEEDVVQMIISEELNIHSSDIVLISYIGLNRLDADRLEFDWIGNGILECRYRTIEITP